MSEIKKEDVLRLAKKFGVLIVEMFDKSDPWYFDVVSAGIECDGFDSLAFVENEQILDHVDLVVKATKKDGVRMLRNYLNVFLNPNVRKFSGIVDGKIQCEFAFDEKMAKIQSALKQQPDIVEILNADESGK